MAATNVMKNMSALQEYFDNLTPDIKNHEVLLSIRKKLSLTNVAYLGLHLPPLTKAKPFIDVTYSNQWVDHYIASDYFKTDPILKIAFKSILPTDWGTIDRKSPEIKRFFEEAKESGVGSQGITIPIRGAHGELSLFSVTLDTNEAEWNKFKRSYIPLLQILAHTLHVRVINENNIQFPKIKLSKRELETLQWASNGKSIQDIAVILQLSHHTVQTYLEMARTKLLALNTTHAVARAIQLQLIVSPE